MRALAALALGAAVSTGAQALEVGGVRYPDALTVQGQPLVLNGAGVRYKTIIRVYTTGLYVSKKSNSVEELLAQAGPKRVSITMLRHIDANELGKLFTKGVEENTPRSEFGKLIPGLVRMGEMFAQHKDLQPGDTLHVDWVPGTGSVVFVKGVAQGAPIQEPAFFNALLRIWLGPAPADWKLKDALLGVSG